MGYRYGEESVTTQVIKSASCDSCNEDIKISHFGAEDALPLILESGYGLFFDAFPKHDLIVLLCKNCATKLCQQWPVFQNVIDNS